MRTALTIAGSDSGGGAGIQADLKTFAAQGVYGVCAVTAVTAQNTMGVTAIHTVPADVVVAQVEAVVGDIGVDAAKTGMLATREVVEAISACIRDLAIPLLVNDPRALLPRGDRDCSMRTRSRSSEPSCCRWPLVSHTQPKRSRGACGSLDLVAVRRPRRGTAHRRPSAPRQSSSPGGISRPLT